MTDDPMTDDDLTPEELASLYLDDEVTPAERARVEADPALLALVERMRQVASQVGAPVTLPDAATRDAAIAAALAVAATTHATPASGPTAAPSPSPASADAVVVDLASRRRWYQHPGVLGVAAALVVVVGAVGVLSRDDDDLGGDTAAVESAETREAVEDTGAESLDSAGGDESADGAVEEAPAEEATEEAPAVEATTAEAAEESPAEEAPAEEATEEAAEEAPAEEEAADGDAFASYDLGDVGAVDTLRQLQRSLRDALTQAEGAGGGTESASTAVLDEACGDELRAAAADQGRQILGAARAVLAGQPVLAVLLDGPAVGTTVEVLAVDAADCTPVTG